MEQKLRKIIRKILFKEYITPKNLKSVRDYADDLFSNVGVDVEFSKHFFDRVNDIRNVKDITPEELKMLYKKAYEKYSNKISNIPPGKEAVLTDLDTQINIPFVMTKDSDSKNLDMVGKTVMRKKDFKSYNPKLKLENENKNIKLKDILDFPSELSDIFDICKNEIELNDNDSLLVSLYSKIYADCLLTYHNLTNGYVDMIKTARENIKKSNNIIEAKKQYKFITNPNNEFSAVLLKMINNYKKLNFEKEKMKKFNVIEMINKLVSYKLTGKTYLSNSFIKELLNSKIEESLLEDINVPINIGDDIWGGKFLNKKVVVKSIGKNKKGDITINDKPLLKVRLKKDN